MPIELAIWSNPGLPFYQVCVPESIFHKLTGIRNTSELVLVFEKDVLGMRLDSLIGELVGQLLSIIVDKIFQLVLFD